MEPHVVVDLADPAAAVDPATCSLLEEGEGEGEVGETRG